MNAKKKMTDEEDVAAAEELAEAADETPTDVTAPETDDRTKDLTEWDDAPVAHGTAAPKRIEEDEDDSLGAQLVYDGTDEAERERRMAAADPDFEP